VDKLQDFNKTIYISFKRCFKGYLYSLYILKLTAAVSLKRNTHR